MEETALQPLAMEWHRIFAWSGVRTAHRSRAGRAQGTANPLHLHMQPRLAASLHHPSWAVFRCRFGTPESALRATVLLPTSTSVKLSNLIKFIVNNIFIFK
jgi:hypothetical protein